MEVPLSVYFDHIKQTRLSTFRVFFNDIFPIMACQIVTRKTRRVRPGIRTNLSLLLFFEFVFGLVDFWDASLFLSFLLHIIMPCNCFWLWWHLCELAVCSWVIFKFKPNYMGLVIQLVLKKVQNSNLFNFQYHFQIPTHFLIQFNPQKWMMIILKLL